MFRFAARDIGGQARRPALPDLRLPAALLPKGLGATEIASTQKRRRERLQPSSQGDMMTNALPDTNRRTLLGGLAGGLMLGLHSPRPFAAPSGKPIRVGSTLSLTGPLAQTALLHRIAGEVFVDSINEG